MDTQDGDGNTAQGASKQPDDQSEGSGPTEEIEAVQTEVNLEVVQTEASRRTAIPKHGHNNCNFRSALRCVSYFILIHI